MNNHAGWGQDGKCVWCGATEPEGACDPRARIDRLEQLFEDAQAKLNQTLERLADARWVLGILEEEIREAGWSVTYHDGGMAQSPSGTQRMPHAWLPTASSIRKEQDAHAQLTQDCVAGLERIKFLVSPIGIEQGEHVRLVHEEAQELLRRLHGFADDREEDL